MLCVAICVEDAVTVGDGVKLGVLVGVVVIAWLDVREGDCVGLGDTVCEITAGLEADWVRDGDCVELGVTRKFFGSRVIPRS